MAKYHAYSLRTSDGKESVSGFSHKQMMKFAQDKNGFPSPWLIEQKTTEDGKPVMKSKKDSLGRPLTVTLTHEYEEIDFSHEAQARGLRAVAIDDKGVVRHTEDKPYVKTFGVATDIKGTLVLAEVEPEQPKTAEQIKAEQLAEINNLTAELNAKKAKLGIK